MNRRSPLEKRVEEALSGQTQGDPMSAQWRRIAQGLGSPMESAPPSVVQRAVQLGSELKPEGWLARVLKPILVASQSGLAGARSLGSLVEQHRFDVEGRALRLLVDGDQVQGTIAGDWWVSSGDHSQETAEGRFSLPLGPHRTLEFLGDTGESFEIVVPDPEG